MVPGRSRMESECLHDRHAPGWSDCRTTDLVIWLLEQFPPAGSLPEGRQRLGVQAGRSKEPGTQSRSSLLEPALPFATVPITRKLDWSTQLGWHLSTCYGMWALQWYHTVNSKVSDFVIQNSRTPHLGNKNHINKTTIVTAKVQKNVPNMNINHWISIFLLTDQL